MHILVRPRVDSLPRITTIFGDQGNRRARIPAIPANNDLGFVDCDCLEDRSRYAGLQRPAGAVIRRMQNGRVTDGIDV